MHVAQTKLSRAFNVRLGAVHGDDGFNTEFLQFGEGVVTLRRGAEV